MSHHTPIRNARHGEEGYLLVWVMFMLFIFALWLSVAVPRTAKEIQRDRELETMRRGKQYIRAVQLYFRKFHAYPPNADALINTNQIRFLRKKYTDPTTGKDDWRPIRYGSTKTQTLGFFGQPIAGAGSAANSVVAGVGPSGNGGLGGSSIGSSSAFGGSSIFSPSGTSGSSITSGTSTATGTGTTGITGASGTGNTGSSSSFGSSDQSTFGGVGIVGFSPASTATSILIYKKKQHYNEWEFTYDPLTDIQTQSGNSGAIGQPVGSSSTSGSSSGSSSNTNSSTSGSNNSSGSGSSTTTNSTSTN